MSSVDQSQRRERTPSWPPQPRRFQATTMLVLLLAGLGVIATVLEGADDPHAPTGAHTEAPYLPGLQSSPGARTPPPATDDLPADTTLVWSGFRLGEGYAEAVAADPRVPVSTVVRGATGELVRTRDADGEVVDELPAGWWYPVEVLAFEAGSYDAVLGRELLGGLEPDEAVISESSAEIRRLAPGAVLEFAGGHELEVVEVVPDELIGAAEVGVTREAPLEVTTEKYLLARPGTEEVETALSQLGTEDREPRLVPHGTTPVLRHAHSVLPPVERKTHFGEFAMQDLSGRDIRPGHSWVEEHITVESVPVLGRVRCHREVFEPLRAAMQELIDRGAAHVVDDYAGCWVPRTSGATGPLSSHAWGMSVDFNAPANPYGAPPSQPEVLVEVMTDHGFLWGGDWDVPDGMHFELAPGRETARER